MSAGGGTKQIPHAEGRRCGMTNLTF